MFDIGGMELLILAALALIVVGPKDLPGLIRNVGRWVAKARGLAREFQSGMEEAAREADLDKELGSIRKISNPRSAVMDEINKFGEETKREIEDGLDGTPLDASGSARTQPPRPPSPTVSTEPPVRRIEPGKAPEPAVSRSEPAHHPADGDVEAPAPASAAADDAFLEDFQRKVGFKTAPEN
ncbi:MAG: Sec-independent protein translocase protein TatB [Neomegalonema sp.]|nr:Sec-independent protein translocase protein TatB [Neomegalonema sp.]